MARLEDSEAITEIYNQGIQERSATFETRFRTAEDIKQWFDGVHPVVVTDFDGRIIAFAASFIYRPRECYSGVAEFSVYVHKEFRNLGAGRASMIKLIEELAKAGFWKLVSRVFPENAGSRKLLAGLGFREAGTYFAHGRMDGALRDVIIVEYLITQKV